MLTYIHPPTPLADPARRLTLLCVLLLGTVISLLLQLAPTTMQPSDSELLASLPPLQFLPSISRNGDITEMQAHALGGTVSFLPQQIKVLLPDTDPIHIEFVGADLNTRLVGGEPLPGVVNDIRGNDPAQWRTNIPSYASLTYQTLYPGIDLQYDGTVDALKGTYLVQPHVDPTVIGWRYEGIRQVQIDAVTGDLHMILHNGRMLTEQAPIAWQDVNGRRIPVEVRYTLTNGTVGFALGDYIAAHPLIIDPKLAYSTFIGGGLSDAAHGVATDAQGNIYLTGSTVSTNFPTTAAIRGSDRDVFVTKLDPTGTSIMYSTLIGGHNADDGIAIAVNAAGEAVVTVMTFSDDFPTKNALDNAAKSSALVKLDASGNLAFSTYLNATMYEARRNIGLDQDSNIYVTADVENNDFGVLKLSSDGQQVLAEAIFGGRGQDTAMAIAVRAGGTVYLTGKTEAYRNNFPVTADALQPECAYVSDNPDASCSRDAFLMILDANLQTRYSSFLGGSFFEEGAGIALDPQGNIAIVGTTHSSDFPVKNAVQQSCPDGVMADNTLHCNSWESFVTKFSPDGKQLVFSTYFSSSDWSGDVVKDVAVDNGGTIHLLGWTNSTKYPVKDAVQTNLATGICLNAQSERLCEDAVVSAFAPNGALVYSTYLGGKKEDYPNSIVAADGHLWIVGETSSSDFPTTANAYQPQKSLNQDVFVAKLGSSLPTGPRGSRSIYLPLVQR